MVPLYAERDGSGPRLVLVHGFTQTRDGWGELAVDLRRDHEVVRVDAPGHGRSAAIEADLHGGALALAATGGRATYLGYSMGGRLALHLALARPDLVERLVLVSATAGIDDDSERRTRREADEGLARRLEADGVEAFLEAWLALPLFAGLPPTVTGLEARRENTVAGLASSLRLAGTGTQRPLWDRSGALTMPVLVVAGERDAKFTALAHRLAGAIGSNATLAVVDDAGHATHLERPASFLGVLRAWLDANPPQISRGGVDRPRVGPPPTGRRP